MYLFLGVISVPTMDGRDPFGSGAKSYVLTSLDISRHAHHLIQ